MDLLLQAAMQQDPLFFKHYNRVPSSVSLELPPISIPSPVHLASPPPSPLSPPSSASAAFSMNAVVPAYDQSHSAAVLAKSRQERRAKRLSTCKARTITRGVGIYCTNARATVHISDIPFVLERFVCEATKETVFKSSDVARQLRVTSNRMAMYFARHRRHANRGIYQALSYNNIRGPRKDLKAGNMFVTQQEVADYMAANSIM